jgi:hypothetical protein
VKEIKAAAGKIRKPLFLMQNTAPGHKKARAMPLLKNTAARLFA